MPVKLNSYTFCRRTLFFSLRTKKFIFLRLRSPIYRRIFIWDQFLGHKQFWCLTVVINLTFLLQNNSFHVIRQLYDQARLRALITFDCFALMTMASGRLLCSARERIYSFTTYKARALRNCVGQSLSRQQFEDPVMDSLPVSPRDRVILTVRVLVTTSFKQRPIERTAKQLYTYFIEFDIVFRIAIVHVVDLETAIYSANVMTWALEKYCLRTAWGTRTANKLPKVFKRLQMVNWLMDFCGLQFAPRKSRVICESVLRERFIIRYWSTLCFYSIQMHFIDETASSLLFIIVVVFDTVLWYIAQSGK